MTIPNNLIKAYETLIEIEFVDINNKTEIVDI